MTTRNVDSTEGIPSKLLHLAPRRALIEAAVVYVVFCGISYMSRLAPAFFALMIFFGIAFPILWNKLMHVPGGLGFTRRNAGAAVGWGVVSGVLFGLFTLAVYGVSRPMPPLLAVQIAIGLPVWLLFMSPFQEFLFRGWLQPHLQVALGRWPGLMTASLAFTLWHFFPPLAGTLTATLPIHSPSGLLSALVLGVVMGYGYDRTRNMLAPWLGHAIAGLALVFIGMMTFLQYTP